MKVLLDVGANTGQTAGPALDPQYGFDRVVCFEPSPSCWPSIEAIGDTRLELCRFGLWKETCKRSLYDPGNLGASIFEDMEYQGRSNESVTIDLVRATDWMSQNISSGDVVFMKLNCEGAEVDIIEDLMNSRELEKIYNAMITFDVRHSSSLRGRELPLRRRLRDAGYRNVSFSEDVMHGATHEDRIRHWLDLVGAHERLSLADLRREYAPTLARLSRRTGRLARFELALREQVFRRLPSPLKHVSRVVWGRLMRGRRAG